jgi:hypothetical protein
MVKQTHGTALRATIFASYLLPFAFATAGYFHASWADCGPACF